MDERRMLPGFLKKSFSLNFNGGELWIEHLDGIYEHEDLVLEKFENDIITIIKPATSSYVCFNFDETNLSDTIINRVVDFVCNSGKRFMKICFVSVSRKNANKFKKKLVNSSIPIAFINDFEQAKEWLL